MSKRIQFLFVTLFAVVLSLGSGRVAFAADEDTELAKTMEKMNKHYKAIKKDLEAGAINADTTKAAGEMKKFAVKCKDYIPAKAEKLKGDEKEKFIAEYKKGIDALVAQIEKLETALKDGKADAAAAEVKKLGKIKADGHDQFQDDPK